MKESNSQHSILLAEYITSANRFAAQQLLISYGIMANSDTSIVKGLLQLLSSADDDTVFKIINLDPNASLHQAYFESLQEENARYELPLVISDKAIKSQIPESYLGNISISNLVEIFLVLAILFAITKMFLMITQMFKGNE